MPGVLLAAGAPAVALGIDRLAAAAPPSVELFPLVLSVWPLSAAAAAVGIHRALWPDRLERPPAWKRWMITGLLTLVWAFIVLKIMSALYPVKWFAT
jgi:hypothetical protein